jgi:N-acetylneuraminic acid mutarotase
MNNFLQSTVLPLPGLDLYFRLKTVIIMSIFLFSLSGCDTRKGKSDHSEMADIGQYNIRTGLIYRNPKPHVYSKHGYFPSVTVMDNGKMLASFAIGEAFEAANSDTYISLSGDMGETWSEPVKLLDQDERILVSNYARIAAMPDGSVTANIVRCHREDHPEEGLANPETLGFVPTGLLLLRSYDHGKSWGDEGLITPPLTGPSFEMCSPLVALSDGRWIWPTSTWRGWDGYCPDGMKMVALVSDDKGRSWSSYMEVMNRSEEKIIFWEGKIIELSDGALLAVAWAYDEANGKNLPNQYTISRNGGKTWQKPSSAGIMGETMAIAAMPDGKVVAVYRRMDRPGLWINKVRIEGDRWINENEIPLWGVQQGSLTDKSGNMVQDFNELRFGAPCVTVLPDTTIYIAFWCYENMVSNIRWFKLDINKPDHKKKIENEHYCRVSEGIPLPDELIRGGHAGGLAEGTVIVAGGNNWCKDKTTKYWLKNSLFFRDGSWHPGPDLPKPLAYSMYAHDKNGLYIAGGTVDGDLLSADTYVLNSLKDGSGWKKLPQLPKAMAYGAGAIFEGKFYVTCGSYGTEYSREIWVLDLSDPEADWRECNSLPGKARMFPSFVPAGKYLYLLGGLAETSPLTPLNDIFRYDPGKDQWEQLKDMPFKGYAWVSSPVDDERLILTGRADGTIHDEIWIVDLNESSFKIAGNLIIPSTTAPLVQVRTNEWWLIGGEPDADKNRTGKVSVIQTN